MTSWEIGVLPMSDIRQLIDSAIWREYGYDCWSLVPKGINESEWGASLSENLEAIEDILTMATYEST
jgi:hypothetical protein